jgi:hypothetical protein
MSSVDLMTVMRYKPEIVGRLTEETIRMYEQGKIRAAVPTKVLAYSQIEEALRMLQSGKGTGKIVFQPTPEDLVPIAPKEVSPYQFDSNATYILAGGLGGIGRSLGKWMATRGAKNLVFLSRSGKITPAVEEMKADLESKGCRYHIFACDVSDKARLSQVIDECRAMELPIKGCITGAMTLKVGTPIFYQVCFFCLMLTQPRMECSKT